MSLEECERITAERVKEHFKPKPPKQPEKVINPGDLKFSIGMCETNKKKFILPSDYDRSITKSFEKKKLGSSPDVPQLGAQKKQSIEPLVVLNQEQQGLLAFFEIIEAYYCLNHRVNRSSYAVN